MKEVILDYAKICFLVILLLIMIGSFVMFLINWNIFWCFITTLITGTAVSFNFLLMDDELCDEDEDDEDLE